MDRFSGRGTGQQLHDPYSAGGAAFGVIQTGFLIGQGGHHQIIEIIPVGVLLEQPDNAIETRHVFFGQRIACPAGIFQVAFEQDIAHQGPFAVLAGKGIDLLLQLRAVFAESPADATLLAQGQIGVKMDLFENLFPENSFVTVHDQRGDKPGV